MSNPLPPVVPTELSSDLPHGLAPDLAAKLTTAASLPGHLPAPGPAPVDMETRLTEQNEASTKVQSSGHQSLRLWLRLLSCTTLIETEIRSRLRSEFDTTLPRFDLMAQLERHPQGLRMGELSKRMMVTGANITGITDQLEQEKLVQRIPDLNDRRVFSVKLTEQGRAAFSLMAQQHEQWISELFAPLLPEQKNQLYDLLGPLKNQHKT